MSESPETPEDHFVCSMATYEWEALRRHVEQVEVRARRLAIGSTVAVLVAVLSIALLIPRPSVAVLALVAAGSAGLMFYAVHLISRRRGFDALTADLEKQIATVLDFDLTSDDLVRLIDKGGTIAGQFLLKARQHDGLVEIRSQDLDTPEHRRSRMWLTDGLT